MKKITILTVILMYILTGCFEKGEPPEMKENKVAGGKEGVTGLQDIYRNYLDIKDALYNAESDKAMKGARAIQTDLRYMDSLELNKTMIDSIRYYTDEIANTGLLTNQRMAFAELSDLLIKIIKENNGISGEHIYVMYCPRSVKDNGAYWLSQDKKVQNPYQNREVKISCGKVAEEIHGE